MAVVLEEADALLSFLVLVLTKSSPSEDLVLRMPRFLGGEDEVDEEVARGASVLVLVVLVDLR